MALWHESALGVEDELGLTHSLSTCAGSLNDVIRDAALLHGEEQRVCSDSGYQRVDKRPGLQNRDV